MEQSVAKCKNAEKSGIEYKEIKDGGWAFHNFEHVRNVSKIAEKILTDLNFEEETIYRCKIACLLHDVGALQGKEGHAQRSFEYARKLFEDKNWIFEDSESVLDAIKNHSSRFETNNIIALATILADKLDIKKTRMSETGKKVKGKMIMKEINNYYFTEKVFKAIEAFSEKLNLKYYILIDNKTWDLQV